MHEALINKILCDIMQPRCIRLRDLRYLRENIHARVLNLSTQKKPKYFPADLADLRRQTTKQPLPQTNCLSLRDNAACCIPLRHLRYLRENTHARVLNQSTQTKPQYLPQISQIYADKTPKQQNHIKLTTNPICLSLRDNAACCIPLRNLRDLRENIHPNLLNQYTQMKPQYLPLISQIYADKPQNDINLTNLSFSAG